MKEDGMGRLYLNRLICLDGHNGVASVISVETSNHERVMQRDAL